MGGLSTRATRWLTVVPIVVIGCGKFPESPPHAVVTPSSQRAVANPKSNRAHAEFRVENCGGSNLVLGAASQSCRCSVTSVEPKVIPPGGSGTISVDGAIAPLMEKVVSLTVESNSQPKPTLSLQVILVGTTIPPLVASVPPSVSFGIVAAKSGLRREAFEIQTLEGHEKDSWLGKIVPSQAGLCVSLIDVREVRTLGDACVRAYRYEVMISSDTAPLGELSNQLSIYERSGDGRLLATIPVHAFVRRAVYAAPAHVQLVQTGDQPISATVTLACVDPKFSLECECVSWPSDVDVRLVERNSRRSVYRVISHPAASATQLPSLVFRTNHPDAGRVEVPISLRHPIAGAPR